MHEQDLGNNYGSNLANDVSRGGSALMGFLCGAVVGAGIALLLAPATGEETRRRIGDTARRLQEDTKDRIGQVKEQAKERIGQARGTLEEITEDAKSAFQVGRDAYSRQRQERSSSTVPSA